MVVTLSGTAGTMSLCAVAVIRTWRGKPQPGTAVTWKDSEVVAKAGMVTEVGTVTSPTGLVVRATTVSTLGDLSTVTSALI